ncbi:MAG TPA: CbrC family protein, partial [Terriglobales bacterium]|nr:CbrC family protein [Terriglobales bacterium]
IIASEKACEVCGQKRTFIYSGVPYAKTEIECICPWCIADGSAHDKFGTEFVAREFIGGGEWDTVPSGVADEVAFRTPGFSGWQQERWFTHCGDAAEFLGAMGKAELQQLGAEAIEVVKRASGYEDKEWEIFRESLDAKCGPSTAYLFRCGRCRKIGGYSDCK